MPRPRSNAAPFPLPPQPDPDLWPRFLTAPQCEAICDRYFFPASHRTIKENWSLKWRIVGGRAVTNARDFLAEAARRIDSAPIVIGARPDVSEHEAA